MATKFKVKVNKSHSFELNKAQADQLDLVMQRDQFYHILKNNKSFKAELVQTNFKDKSYVVKINSNTYHIKIENELASLVLRMGYSLGASKKMKFIKAPMPGIIIKVNIKKGDKVKEGETLLVLEAMKMENALTSPKDGVIRSILVKDGETVDKSKLLVEFE